MDSLEEKSGLNDTAEHGNLVLIDTFKFPSRSSKMITNAWLTANGRLCFTFPCNHCILVVYYVLRKDRSGSNCKKLSQEKFKSSSKCPCPVNRYLVPHQIQTHLEFGPCSLSALVLFSQTETTPRCLPPPRCRGQKI